MYIAQVYPSENRTGIPTEKKIKINGKLFGVFVLFRLDPDQARHSAGPDLRYADDI